MLIPRPEIFSFIHCLSYLRRSDLENTYFVKGESLWRGVEKGEKKYLLRIFEDEEKNVNYEVLNTVPSGEAHTFIQQELREWLDLDTPLHLFYESLSDHPVFLKLIKRFHGLRLIKVPDLFEAIAWAIIGQQINLRFAYQVKKNLVEHCGNYMDYEGEKFFFFPSPEEVLEISDNELQEMKFSRQKIKYLRIVAEKIMTGELSKVSLLKMEPKQARTELMKVKGIGNWTANYVQMRCLNHRNAFPVEDVALHKAIQNEFGLAARPKKEEILKMAESWPEWRAYITFYLWATLRE